MNVLLIDHDVECRYLVRQTMRAMAGPRFHLTEVEHGRDGIEMLRQNAFSCVLLGAHLPDGDGLRFMPDLTASPHAPAVIMLAPEEDRARGLRALAAGAQDFLAWSSLTPDSLARALEYAVERQRLTHALMEGRRRIAQVAFLDPLTGVLNRRGLEHLIAGDVQRTARAGAPFSGIVIDCDDFHRLNERWGQAVGDQVLVEIVRRIHRRVRAHDRFARVGGDEFLVLLPDTDKGDALMLAEKIRASIAAQPIAISGCVLAVTATLAVFGVSADTRGVSDLLAAAQVVLVENKTRGRNRVASVRELPDIGAAAGAKAFTSESATRGVG